MTTLVVEGGHPVRGQIEVAGNKNAALPLLAACLLTEEPCVLHNVPPIGDVDTMVRLLADLGADVRPVGCDSWQVHCPEIRHVEPDRRLVSRLRGSVLLLGPLLARRGRVHLAAPGGDFPTRRTLATHIQALEALGARVREEGGHLFETPDGLRGGSMYLDEASVTGTETAVLAAVGAQGRTEIRHAAMEPHVVELCRFLRKMGAVIEGEGTPTIRVEGGRPLRGVEHRLEGDYIEAGTWAVVAAVTRGELEVRGARAVDLEPIVAVLRRMGVRCTLEDDCLFVAPSKPVAVRRITTGLWPGFPSDMVSLIAVLATQAEGQTLIHDWMYELRLFALEQLSGMRADLFLCDPHRIIVTGPSRLRGTLLDSRDLRSGMALIAAALAADGESRIRPLETVERGYARIVDRLRAVGARVSVES